MFTPYFDESFDGRERQKYPVFVIAGYFGLQGHMLELHWQWEKKLKHWDLPYFKASECEFGFGPFARYRETPANVAAPLLPHEKDRLREVKTSFVDVVQATGIQVVGIGAAVRLDHFGELLRTDPRTAKLLGDTPYFLCYQAMLMQVGLMAGNRNKEWKDRHMVAPIFDSQEECSGRAKQMYDGFRKKNPASSKWLVDTLAYGDDKTYLPLQAADNLAFEVRKFANSIKYDPAKKERVAWTRLKEKCYGILLFDMPILRLILDHNTSPLDEKIMHGATELQDYEI